MNESAITVTETRESDSLFDNRLLTYEQLAAYLQCTERSLKRWVKEGRIPSVECGHQFVRFEKERVLEALRRKKEPPCKK